MKFDISEFIEKKIQVSLKSEKITVSSCNDVCTVMIILGLIALRMRNVSDKICRKNQKNFFFIFPLKSCRL
jgi:hypothetical protein